MIQRWKMTDPDRLVWRCWKEHPTDPLTLIYHKDSDDTHLLNAFGVAILELLEQRPLSVKEILAEWASIFPDAMPPEEEIKRFLAKMVDAGILQIVDESATSHGSLTLTPPMMVPWRF